MKVIVILGSKTDLEKFEKSEVTNIFGKLGISCELAIISAHRHPEELKKYCQSKAEKGEGLVFIAAAGMAAALPGAIASHAKTTPVIGVPLASEGFEQGLDSFLSMWRMPSGVPVLVVDNFKNAAIAACQILGTGINDINQRLEDYLKKINKPAQIGIQKSEAR